MGTSEFEKWEFENLEFENSEVETLELNIEKVFELCLSRLTHFVLVVQLYLAFFSGWTGWGVVGKSDSKENPKSDLDLDQGFVKKTKIKKFLSIFE